MVRAGWIRVGIASLALGTTAGHGAAQLPNPSAAALAMGGNYGAVARGFAAVAWNPALLALQDRPSYSFTVLSTRVGLGLDPVSGVDLIRNANEIVPPAQRSAWLARIRAAGGETGFGSGDITYLALSTGTFALQAATQVQGEVRATPDLAELALSPTGVPDPDQFDVSGSTLDFFATSTVAISYADHFPVASRALRRADFALGATVKYTFGNYLLTGRPSPGSVPGNPFPILRNDTALAAPLSGGGVGIDLGAALRTVPWTVSLSVLNVVNSFAWDEDKLMLSSVEEIYGTRSPSGGSSLVEQAPPELRKRVDDLGFKAVISLAVAYDYSPRLRLSADARRAAKNGMDLGAASRLGLGAEYRLSPMLPLRFGAAVLDGGYQLGAGLALQVRGLDAAVAGGVRHTAFRATPEFMLTFAYVGR